MGSGAKGGGARKKKRRKGQGQTPTPTRSSSSRGRARTLTPKGQIPTSSEESLVEVTDPSEDDEVKTEAFFPLLLPRLCINRYLKFLFESTY